MQVAAEQSLQFFKLFFSIVSNFIQIFIWFPESRALLLVNLKAVNSWDVNSRRWVWVQVRVSLFLIQGLLKYLQQDMRE
jgi:hypothetical protein